MISISPLIRDNSQLFLAFISKKTYCFSFPLATLSALSNYHNRIMCFTIAIIISQIHGERRSIELPK